MTLTQALSYALFTVLVALAAVVLKKVLDKREKEHKLSCRPPTSGFESVPQMAGFRQCPITDTRLSDESHNPLVTSHNGTKSPLPDDFAFQPVGFRLGDFLYIMRRSGKAAVEAILEYLWKAELKETNRYKEEYRLAANTIRQAFYYKSPAPFLTAFQKQYGRDYEKAIAYWAEQNRRILAELAAAYHPRQLEFEFTTELRPTLAWVNPQLTISFVPRCQPEEGGADKQCSEAPVVPSQYPRFLNPESGNPGRGWDKGKVAVQGKACSTALPAHTEAAAGD